MPLLRLAAVAGVILTTQAQAGPRIEGSVIRAHYGDEGVWNDRSASAGLQTYHPDRWIDWTFPGAPFAMWRLRWDDGGSSPEDYFANTNTQAMNAVLLDTQDRSSETHRVARHSYRTGYVHMRKTEAWLADGSVLLMHIFVENTDSRPLTDLMFLYAIDPDPDAGITVNTLNSVANIRGSGPPDTAISAGPSTGRALAFTACTPGSTEVGHYPGWSGPGGATTVQLFDRGGSSADEAMAIRIAANGVIEPGDSTVITFLVAVGESVDEALDEAATSLELCSSCDADGDGWLSTACGGEDCDDNDPTVFPGAEEIWYDGIDQNCDGLSDYDQDMDGFDSDAHPRADGTVGDDCDDLDPNINPDATEIWYDGIDQNCDGWSDYDQDMDGFDSAGHGGDDCNDTDPTIYPGAPDVAGDGVDRNCDGCDGVCESSDDGEIVRGGCGCASATVAPSGWALLGLLPLLGLRRRRG